MNRTMLTECSFDFLTNVHIIIIIMIYPQLLQDIEMYCMHSCAPMQ